MFVSTVSGNIHVQSLYASESSLTTTHGDIHIGSCHGQTNVKVAEGNIDISKWFKSFPVDPPLSWFGISCFLFYRLLIVRSDALSLRHQCCLVLCFGRWRTIKRQPILLLVLVSLGRHPLSVKSCVFFSFRSLLGPCHNYALTAHCKVLQTNLTTCGSANSCPMTLKELSYYTDFTARSRNSKYINIL